MQVSWLSSQIPFISNLPTFSLMWENGLGVPEENLHGVFSSATSTTTLQSHLRRVHGDEMKEKGWHNAGWDISWAEMVAIEITLNLLIAGRCSNALVQFWPDNQGAIGALDAGCSRNDQQNLVPH